jgi:hypothetical protein
MRKYTLLVALVGAIFATAVAFPKRTDALTCSAPAGVVNAATAVDVAQPAGVWRRHHWGYWPQPYYYGYYQPWPYYAYYPYGYYYPYWGW